MVKWIVAIFSCFTAFSFFGIFAAAKKGDRNIGITEEAELEAYFSEKKGKHKI